MGRHTCGRRGRPGGRCHARTRPRSACRRRAQRSPRKRRALTELINYLTPNVDGLWYRERLAEGLPIGSGLIEGACKTVGGGRLKHGGARWLVPRVENVAALCCLLYSDEWEAFWHSDAA